MSMTALPLSTYSNKYFYAGSYTAVAVIYALAMVIGMILFSHFYTKGVKFYPQTQENEEEESFKDTCGNLIKNKYLRAILISDIFYYTGMMTISNLGIYYFRLMGEFGPTYTLINTIIDTAALKSSHRLP